MKCRYCGFEICENSYAVSIMKRHMNINHPEIYRLIKSFLGGKDGIPQTNEGISSDKVLSEEL